MGKPIVVVSAVGLPNEVAGVCDAVIVRTRHGASPVELLAVRAGDPVRIAPAG